MSGYVMVVHDALGSKHNYMLVNSKDIEPRMSFGLARSHTPQPPLAGRLRLTTAMREEECRLENFYYLGNRSCQFRVIGLCINGFYVQSEWYTVIFLLNGIYIHHVGQGATTMSKESIRKKYFLSVITIASPLRRHLPLLRHLFLRYFSQICWHAQLQAHLRRERKYWLITLWGK